MPVTCCFAPADVRSAAEAAERRDGAVPRSCCSLAGKCETLCPSADARLEAPVLALLARARAAVLCPRARVVDVYAQPYCTGLGPPLYSMASILFLILSHSFFPLLLCFLNHTVSPYCACRITILCIPRACAGTGRPRRKTAVASAQVEEYWRVYRSSFFAVAGKGK